MGSIRLATRVSGKKVKVFLTQAGSRAAGKRLAQHPVARQAQSCISGNARNRTAQRACLAKLKKS